MLSFWFLLKVGGLFSSCDSFSLLHFTSWWLCGRCRIEDQKLERTTGVHLTSPFKLRDQVRLRLTVSHSLALNMWHLPTSVSQMLRVQAWAISLGWHTLEEKQSDPFPLSKLEHYGCDSTSASARNLSSLIEKYMLFHTMPVCSFNTCFKHVPYMRIWFVLCIYIKFRDSCIMYIPMAGTSFSSCNRLIS